MSPETHARHQASLARVHRRSERAKALMATGRAADRRKALALYRAVRDEARAVMDEIEAAHPAIALLVSTKLPRA